MAMDSRFIRARGATQNNHRYEMPDRKSIARLLGDLSALKFVPRAQQQTGA